MQGFRVRDANLWSVRGRASAKREARQARAKEKKNARFRIGEYLGRGDRAGSGEARRTSLAFIRIRSRRAPHVGQSDASGNASAGRSHTPLSTACVEERRGLTVRGWFSWKRARNDAETSEGAHAYPLPSRIVSGLRRRLPGLSRGFILSHPARASPRARRLWRASSRTTAKTRNFDENEVLQFFFGAVAKSIQRRRRRPHRSRTHASFESLKLVGVKHHVRG